MGLDSNLYAIDPAYIQDDTHLVDNYSDSDDRPYNARDELAYWRKHWPLHEKMEQIYRSKGGNETFNCEIVVLSVDDITELIEFITEYHSKSNYDYEQTYQYAIDAFNSAIDCINNGQVVYFSSWY